MYAYQARSVTYDTPFVLTKTTGISTQETVVGTDTTPVYTVPAGRIAKIQYLQNTGTGYLQPSAASGSVQAYGGYLKINNMDTTLSGLFLNAINAIDITEPKNIYLSSGDSLYLRYTFTFTSSTSTGVGSTLTEYPSIYISIIEEYDI